MEFNEALTHVKGMNRFFRAFVRLEEVLKVAADAERAVGEANTRKAMLEQEVAALAESGGKLRAEVEELDGTVFTLREHASRYKEEKKEELRGFLAELDAKRESAVAKVQAGIEEAEAAATVEKQRIEDEVKALEAERGGVKEALREAQADLAALQKRVGGLG